MGSLLVRDMDLIRQLLLDAEDGKRGYTIVSETDARLLGIDDSIAMSDTGAAKLEYHLDLLADAGFIRLQRAGIMWQVETITWKGQEFLASVRNSEVWTKAKAGAITAGNQSVAFIWELAKAYGKHLASERLGIKLD